MSNEKDQSKITPSAPPKPYPTSSVQYGHPMNVAPPSYFNGSNHGQFQPTSRMPPPPPYNTNPMGQAMYSIYGYPVSHYPYTQPMVQPSPLPSNVAIVMPDGFDSMARFDGIARPNIPPPPPGVAPNPAQIAMMYGQSNQIVMGQKKPDFF